MKKVMLYFLTLMALFALLSCKQGASVQQQNNNESNEITITVKCDSKFSLAKQNKFKIVKPVVWKNIKTKALSFITVDAQSNKKN